MARWERVVTLLCLAYVLFYGVYFVSVAASGRFFDYPWMVPLHLLGMALSTVLVILVVRDVYKRPFPNPNDKATWALLIVFVNIFAIPVYLWKYGFRPRSPETRRDAA